MLIYFYGSLDAKNIEDTSSEKIDNLIQTNFRLFYGTKIFEFLQPLSENYNLHFILLMNNRHVIFWHIKIYLSILCSLWERSNLD